jgi:hypothetical protein
MHIISTPCRETLFLLTTSSEDEGNYTCVATNKFGEVNSTKEIKIIGKSSFIEKKHFFQHLAILIIGDSIRFLFCSRQ